MIYAMIWFTFAVLFLMIEIYYPHFVFLSLGLGAILIGLLSIRFPTSFILILIFVVLTFLLYLWLRKISKKVFVYTSGKTNVNNLLNKKGILTKGITKKKSGYVKIGSNEWPAYSKSEEHIDSGKTVKVIGFEKNKLLVSIKLQDE
ncbi:MAG: NfeD family protein [Candidatus Cloacimonetes bacterium]|nr:NfeD family protein [Candidatus Cloacimonadota bacterium]